jgi:hypothetical protein
MHLDRIVLLLWQLGPGALVTYALNDVIDDLRLRRR